MIRKLLTACAGLTLLTSAALALDVTGTYAGQSNGQNISVQLQGSDGTVRGSIRIGGAELPLTAREQDGRLQGVWQAPDGQQVPFAARVNGGKLDLATNGVVYSLRNEGTSQPAVEEDRRVAPVQAARQPVREDQQQQPGGMRPMTVHMEQGAIFARPVPDGWKGSENCNETFIVSPDSSMMFGFTGFEGLTPMTPAQFMQWMTVNVYKNENFQTLQQHEVPGNEGGVTVEAIVTFTSKGVPCKSWVRCTVLTAFNSSNGYMQFASAAPEKFDNAAPMLIEMANKIQITDVNAVFDRARRLGVIRSVKNNPIPDTIIVGYNERQKIMDGIGSRRGDVATDTYKLTSDSGQVYYMGQGAYDPTIGGFRDPAHPERVLKMEPHWNGH